MAALLTAPLPSGPVGEAWIFSDRDDHASQVADGPLKGRTVTELLEQFPEQFLGKLAGRFRRFPLLLKFLDAHEMLSVQVHPSDANKSLLPPGETGKTEAWVVVEAAPESRIYAGLKPGTTPDDLRALTKGTAVDRLMCFTPKPGDGVFIPAGTVHALGGDVVAFEIQQNSDVTFSLYDWDHVDAKTGQRRPLQIDQALACVDFADDGAAGLVTPVVEATTPAERERLFHCEHFWLWRIRGQSPFNVGAASVPRILVCIQGAGQVEHFGDNYAVGKGDVLLLPAVVGECTFHPHGAVTLFEIAIPD